MYGPSLALRLRHSFAAVSLAPRYGLKCGLRIRVICLDLDVFFIAYWFVLFLAMGRWKRIDGASATRKRLFDLIYIL